MVAKSFAPILYLSISRDIIFIIHIHIEINPANYHTAIETATNKTFKKKHYIYTVMSIKTLLYILLIQYFFNYPEALRMYMHHVPFSNRELLQRDIKNIIKFSIGSSFLCFKPILQSVSAIESNILATRFYGKGIDKYNPGLTSNDIYYPKWFEGKWNCNSTCVDIAAPLGNLSFGGSRAYERALLELNTSLIYNAKFRQEGQGT